MFESIKTPVSLRHYYVLFRNRCGLWASDIKNNKKDLPFDRSLYV